MVRTLKYQHLIVCIIVAGVVFLHINRPHLYTYYANLQRSDFHIRYRNLTGQMSTASGTTPNRVEKMATTAGVDTLKEYTKHPPPLDAKFLINNESICATAPRLKYIVYVHTAPSNTDRRQALRSSWLNTTAFWQGIMRVVFIVGRSGKPDVEAKLEQEAKRYGDIVQGDFLDTYRNLTLKGVLGLKWVSRFCRKASLLLKVDDDAFVNVFKLLPMLRKYERMQKTIICTYYHDNTMPILRHGTNCGKWCVDSDEFPSRRFYPAYCSGLAYIISSDLVPQMYYKSKTTPFFWVDDVYITGLLPSKIKNVNYISIDENITLVEERAIKEFNDTHKSPTYFFVHCSQPRLFMSMWRLLLRRFANDSSGLSDPI